MEVLVSLILSFIISFVGLTIYRFYILNAGLAMKNWIVDYSSGKRSPVVSGSGILLLGILFFLNVVNVLVPFVIGFTIVIGYLDDGYKLGVKFRLVTYVIGVLLILLGYLFNIEWYLFLLICIGFVGFVNAVNFIDGINGMVVFQCIVILGGMLLSGDWVNYERFILLLFGWLLAFSVFNARVNPKLFLGDAGSIGLGFILFTLFLPKLHDINSFGYLIYFLVIAVDVTSVLILRILRGHNIFERHEMHLYQRITVQNKIPGVRVAFGYAFLQAVLIFFWVFLIKDSNYSAHIVIALFFCLCLSHRILYQKLDSKLPSGVNSRVL